MSLGSLGLTAEQERLYRRLLRDPRADLDLAEVGPVLAELRALGDLHRVTAEPIRHLTIVNRQVAFIQAASSASALALSLTSCQDIRIALGMSTEIRGLLHQDAECFLGGGSLLCGVDDQGEVGVAG
ncbi:hypothetical protein GCM10010404_84230 [Nonomuraea africana]|uniref:Uncharacterized protein n=1 Tax=Nonomuraea africana TaxID=46171 RepID=A0ABR9KJ61_9ACTN|nr:hypothetical protein [Nonomuraea africana]MBE1562053.1 hypothetical protein [Nonomuraea africana]